MKGAKKKIMGAIFNLCSCTTDETKQVALDNYKKLVSGMNIVVVENAINSAEMKGANSDICGYLLNLGG